jgi:uncharacterized membrane protein
MPAHDQIAKDGFRLRGTAMSRIDGFSDVVFGFALTLLVVSLEVPHTYDQFHAALLGFFPFAVCFFFLILVWMAHFRFFRRYGLHDLGTLWINSALLFSMLFYVYPVKFLFAVASGVHVEHVFSNPYQQREMMEVYGLGFSAIYFCLAALYLNAWRQRRQLGLSAIEVTITLADFSDKLGDAFIGLLCVLIAHLLPPQQAGNAGWFFFLIGIWSTINGKVAGRKIRRLRALTPPEDLEPLTHNSESA